VPGGFHFNSIEPTHVMACVNMRFAQLAIPLFATTSIENMALNVHQCGLGAAGLWQGFQPFSRVLF
jgi:hypothetical protein